MKFVSTILAAGIFAAAAAATASYADTLTSRILTWDPIERVITFEDRSQMVLDPELVTEDLLPGDEVTVLFECSENGVDKISEILKVAPAEEAQ